MNMIFQNFQCPGYQIIIILISYENVANSETFKPGLELVRSISSAQFCRRYHVLKIEINHHLLI